MPKEYTLDELIKMGATPVETPATEEFTLEQIQNLPQKNKLGFKEQSIEDVKGFTKSGVKTVKEGLVTPGKVLEKTPEIVKQAVPSLIPQLGRVGTKILETGVGLFKKLGEKIPERFVTPTKEQERGFIAGEVAQLLPISGAGIAKGAMKITGKVYENIAKKEAKKIDNIIGNVLQGKKIDIQKAKKPLSQIDISNVKSYDDLKKSLDTKIEVYSSKFDEVLDRDKLARPLKNLSLPTKVGENGISKNYVDDAIKQLENFYEQTNNQKGVLIISNLRKKAEETGLTVKEINNLAKLHNFELSSKAFSKLGEPLKGINALSAENTRKGVKATARRLYGDKVFQDVDSEISNLIRTRDLIEKVGVEVNKLRQKVTERGLGEKAGRLVFQVVDKFTGGGLKGFIQSFARRGEGLKLMNALELDTQLKKNLNLIKRVLNPNTSEDDVVKILNSLLKKEIPKPKLLGPGAIPTKAKPDISGVVKQPAKEQLPKYPPEFTPSRLLPPGKKGTIPGKTIKLLPPYSSDKQVLPKS